MKIYLASPYSHKDSDMREIRFNQACIAAGSLFQKGYFIYSPITSWHPVSLQSPIGTTFSTFKYQDFSFIDWSDELWVLTLPAWSISLGVEAEIKYAKRREKKVRKLTLEEAILHRIGHLPKEL